MPPTSKPTREVEIDPQTAAREVTADLIARFRLADGSYAGSIANRGPADAWANGVILPALLAAARDDPTTMPAVRRFITTTNLLLGREGTSPRL